MYKFIKIRHYIIKECHGNYEEMKIFNYYYKLEIEIFRNSTQNLLGVLRGSFQVFGCPKRHPDALLAKTMLSLHIHTFLHLRWEMKTNLSYALTFEIDQLNEKSRGVQVHKSWRTKNQSRSSAFQ